MGATTLDLGARHADRYRVFALSANRSADALLPVVPIALALTAL
jgi:hypothetical protein